MSESPRVAIITGGSSGIGLATGRMLVERGYDVVLTARREAPLMEAADAIGARYVAADSVEPDQFGRVIDACDRVDFVVHAAGVNQGTFVRKESIDTFDNVLRVNLRSAFVVAQGAMTKMPAGGRFVFVSSSSAHGPHPGKAAYSASKAGLNAFAFALAKEADRDGISVHVVTTGPVDTPMLDDVRFPMLALNADDVAQAIVFLDTLPPNVRLPEVQVSSVENGPFKPELLVPEAAKQLGRNQI